MRESGQADWAPLEEDRADVAGRPSVIVLPVPRPYKTRIAKEAINKMPAGRHRGIYRVAGERKRLEGAIWTAPADDVPATSPCCFAAARRPERT